MVRDPALPNEGPLYFTIQRGRNIADQWTRAREGLEPAVSVLDSRGTASVTPTSESHIVSVNVRSGAVTIVAKGALHLPTISADGRTLSYRRENPAPPPASVA